jgi:hypothetical protein
MEKKLVSHSKMLCDNLLCLYARGSCRQQTPPLIKNAVYGKASARSSPSLPAKFANQSFAEMGNWKSEPEISGKPRPQRAKLR